MTRRVRAPGAHPMRGRWRARSLAGVLTLALTATVATLIPTALPASADTVTTSATLALNCTAQSPIGAQAANQDLTISIDHPDKIARNTVEQVVVSQPAMLVPDEVGGYTLNRLSNIAVGFKVPSQFRVESATTVHLPLEPGNVQAAATVTYTPTGDVTFSIPGPLNANNTYQLPELHIGLRAVGTPGTSGGFLFQNFTVTANANLPVFGASNLPTTCPTPSPNPPMFFIEVGPGQFSTAPDPVIAAGTVVQPTVSKYGSSQVPSGTGRTNNEFTFVSEHMPDTKPGEVLDIKVTPPSKDWTAPYQADPHTINTRQMSKFRNLKFELGGPDLTVFEVVSVTSDNPGVMTASYNAATNTISLATLNNVATSKGSALALPAIHVKVKALTDGSTYRISKVTFKKVTFEMAYQTQTCIVICFGFGSDKWMTATTQGTAPGGVPVGTQPNDSLYFPQVATGQVLTTFGVKIPPGANPDHVEVANNVSGIDIDVLANDTPGTLPFDPSTVTIIDDPSAGTVEVNQINGIVTYAPTYGTLEKTDGFTYAVKDTGAGTRTSLR